MTRTLLEPPACWRNSFRDPEPEPPKAFPAGCGLVVVLVLVFGCCVVLALGAGVLLTVIQRLGGR